MVDSLITIAYNSAARKQAAYAACISFRNTDLLP